MIIINPDVIKPADNLRNAADVALRCTPCAVTDFSRPDIAPRNYYSLGRYYHPNPDTPDGLPWISRDGIVNPTADAGPKSAMREMIRNTLILSGAGYFIDKKYTHVAEQLLIKWFLDAQCAMSPNLNNAQMVPGLNTGRRAGIIDSHIWINIILAMDFLTRVSSNATLCNGMRDWFGRYADWLETSPNGVAARNIGNNISAWHMAQLVAFSLFAGNRDDYISRCVDMFKWFITERMDDSGCFYGELTRTRSLHYCLFHLNAMAVTAQLIFHAGMDLWHWRDATGKGLERAFEFLGPFISGVCEWPHPQIDGETFPTQFSFYLAGLRYNRSDFSDINKHAARNANFGDVFGPDWMWPGMVI